MNQGNKRLSWTKPLFLSALLSALPLTVPSLFFLSWFSFVPLFFILLQEREKKGIFRASLKGVFFGFFYHFFVYFWFLWLYPLDFAGLSNAASLFVVLLAWIGISLLHGSLFAIPFLLVHFASRKIASRPFLLTLSIFGILLAQRLQGASELAFPWVRVSLGQYKATPLIQSASLFGMEGLDLLILSVSALLTLAFVFEKKKRLLSFSLALLLFALNFSYGIICRFIPSEGETIKVSAVQGCILSGEKWSGSQTALETYLGLTKSLDETVDLVIWPESAVPVNLATSPSLEEIYRELVRETKTPLLTGVFHKKDGLTTNSAVLVEEGKISDPYSKRVLVPFGERMPYREILSRLFPVLTEINMLSNDLAPGEDASLFDFHDQKIGSIICFESIFSETVRQSAVEGANLFVVVTNDSWYEDSPAVWQHLAHSVFRSVENGRGTVRCANSGVSAFIDEKGRITSKLDPLERGVLTDTAQFSEKETLYTRVGDVSFYVLFILLIIWAALLVSGRKKRA